MTAETPATELTDAESADLYALIRDYLMDETDATRPQSHASTLTRRILAARAKPAPSGDEREVRPEWPTAAHIHDDTKGVCLYNAVSGTWFANDDGSRLLNPRQVCERDHWPVSPAPSGADREALGRLVREVWVEWAREQPNPKPTWLIGWDVLAEPDKEVDRRIGERLYAEGTAAPSGAEAALRWAADEMQSAAEHSTSVHRKNALEWAAEFLVRAALAPSAGPDEATIEVGFRYQDGEVITAEQMTRGLGIFDNEDPTLVLRNSAEDEWLPLADYRAEHDTASAGPDTTEGGGRDG